MARILVVDDDLVVLDVITKLLERLKHEAVPVGSACEALALLDGPGHFDLAIIDLVLIGMSGLDLIRRVRLKRPSFPMVAMSGYVCPESTSVLEALRVAGVTQMLGKPVAISKLDATVTAALPRMGLHQRAASPLAKV